MGTIEQMIQKKAYELGYEKCGIIPISLMEGYAEKVKERTEKVPKSKMFYQNQQRLLNPLEIYPWAKSVVVLAVQCGIGIVRRNNFLYTESGSWVHLEAWVTDREMELKETNDVLQCPKNCNPCMASCSTKSLSDPYTMSLTACISFLTTFGGRNLSQEPLSRTFGNCIYGCDICQDVCPMNKGKWKEEEFPGLAELSSALTPENILNMEEDFYREKVQPKYKRSNSLLYVYYRKTLYEY